MDIKNTQKSSKVILTLLILTILFAAGGLNISSAANPPPGLPGGGGYPNDYFGVIVRGKYNHLTWWKQTNGYVSCPPSSYTVTDYSANVERGSSDKIYIVFTIPNLHEYNGNQSHCLTYCGLYELQYNTSTGGYYYYLNVHNYSIEHILSLSFQSGFSYLEPIFENGTFSHYKANIAIYYNQSTNKLFLDMFYNNLSPLSPLNYFGSNIPIDVYKDDVKITTISYKIGQEFNIPNYGAGNYKLKINANTNIININITPNTCNSVSNLSIKVKTNVEFTYTITSENEITNKLLVSPTELDKIPPYTKQEEGEEPPSPYDIPSPPPAPEPEEGEEPTTFIGRILQGLWNLIREILFECDIDNLNYFRDQYYYLMSKFPFRIIMDLRDIFYSIGTQCPIWYIQGPNNTTGVFSICQYIPSGLIYFVKIVINIFVITLLLFSLYRIVIKFFTK